MSACDDEWLPRKTAILSMYQVRDRCEAMAVAESLSFLNICLSHLAMLAKSSDINY